MKEFCIFMIGVGLASIAWALVLLSNRRKFDEYAAAAEKMIDELKSKIPRLVLVLAIGMALVSPAMACDVSCDSWLDHDTIYANWDHLVFSWYGYKNISFDDVFNSYSQGWWGHTVYYPWRVEIGE